MEVTPVAGFLDCVLCTSSYRHFIPHAFFVVSQFFILNSFLFLFFYICAYSTYFSIQIAMIYITQDPHTNL